MRQILATAGVEFEVFKAIDGKHYDFSKSYSDELQDQKFLRRLSGPELGCFMSHYLLWELIQSNDLEGAVILEDDISVEPNLGELIERASSIPHEYDLIRLAGLGKVPQLDVMKLSESHSLTMLMRGSTGTQGYIISRHGARKLLKRAMPISVPVDVFIDHNWISGIKTLAIRPYPVTQNTSLESSISGERHVSSQKNKSGSHATRKERLAKWRRKRTIAALKVLYYPVHAMYGIFLKIALWGKA